MGPEIQELHIKKFSLKMSASEMRIFLYFLPLMIGHKIDSKNHGRIWDLLIQLIILSEKLMQSILIFNDIKNIKEMVQKYLKNRIKVFKEPLKPKHHFLLHYSECIEQSGPLHNIMTFSYEQKKRMVKKYAKITHQRVNLPWSLMYKSLMNFNRFINNHSNGFPSIIQIPKDLQKTDFNNLMQKEYFHNEWFMKTDKVYELKWLKFKSTLYKPGLYMVLDEDLIKCFKIKDILMKNELHLLILEQFQVLNFDDHKKCYNIGASIKIFRSHVVADFLYFPFNLHKTQDGKTSFRLKHV